MSVVSDSPGRAEPNRGDAAVGTQTQGGVRGGLGALGERWNNAGPFNPPPRSEWPTGLRRVRTVGLVLLGLQLIGFMFWSWTLVHRASLTWDFSIYQQAAWLIGHGHLDPYSTLLYKPFWKNDGEFIIWPLALLVRVGPGLVTLPWLQDMALVGGEAIALLWMCDIAARHSERTGASRFSVALVGLGIVLLIGNPWLIWTVSFDVHMEPFITLFLLAAARDLYRGRRRAFVWVGCGLLCGTVGAGYLGAMGVSAALTGRWLRRRGLTIAGAGFLILLAFMALHAVPAHVIGDLYAPIAIGNKPLPHTGVPTSLVVKGALEHPGRALSILWAHRANIWGSLSPGGVLGLFWLPVTIPALLILGEGGLGNGALLGFETPGFQNVALAALIALGTVALCAALASRTARTGRRRWLLPTVMSVMAVNSVVWSVVWLPEVSTNWLLVSPAAASTLRKVQAEMGTNAQVLVSQGVAGEFSERRWVSVIFQPAEAVPLHERTAWIILAPKQGIESALTSGIYADIAVLEKDPSMHLMADANGVWAFKWTPPAGAKNVSISPVVQRYSPGWAAVGAAGSVVRKGPTSDWYASSNDSPGYVVDQAYWRGLRGTYRASFTLAVANGTYANAELWDSTTGTLLGRLVVKPTNGRRTVELTTRLRRTIGQPVISGQALWSVRPQKQRGDALEIRIWSPGRAARVRVYRVAVEQLTGNRLDNYAPTAQQQLDVGSG
jgi:Predicted membrane protein (DUF2079)